MVRALVAAAVGLLLLAPAASASFPKPTGMTVVRAPCPDGGGEGCSYVDSQAIAAGAYGVTCTNVRGCVYVSGDRYAYWHELGHVWDAQILDDADRAWFARLLGALPGQGWLEGQPRGRAAPVELFADAYANCALRYGYGRRWNRRAVGYGYDVSIRTHHRICNAIVILAMVARQGPPKGVIR